LDAVLLDPEIIHRVLDNIVRNAIDSMPNGGVLTVAAGRDGDVVELRVSDTGVGIPEGVRDRVFEPFYTTKSKGTGLGLAYCRRGVEAHGGSITFDSLEGEGTTFKVRLPRVENVSRNR
jgi:signal transduction histidine kinase